MILEQSLFGCSSSRLFLFPTSVCWFVGRKTAWPQADLIKFLGFFFQPQLSNLICILPILRFLICEGANPAQVLMWSAHQLPVVMFAEIFQAHLVPSVKSTILTCQSCSCVRNYHAGFKIEKSCSCLTFWSIDEYVNFTDGTVDNYKFEIFSTIYKKKRKRGCILVTLNLKSSDRVREINCQFVVANHKNLFRCEGNIFSAFCCTQFQPRF